MLLETLSTSLGTLESFRVKNRCSGEHKMLGLSYLSVTFCPVLQFINFAWIAF